jgi:formate hydrogenlyase subunit 4
VGYLYILTIKFRKSPFDLSMTHHAHQEIVKGLSTEFSGKALAAIEVAHWYENVLLLGIIYLFFSFHPLLGSWPPWALTFSKSSSIIPTPASNGG